MPRSVGDLPLPWRFHLPDHEAQPTRTSCSRSGSAPG